MPEPSEGSLRANSETTPAVSIAARVALDSKWLASAPHLLEVAFWRQHGLTVGDPPCVHSHSNPTVISPKVGRYFEQLHESLMRATTNFLAAHRVIQAHDRTLGELDFLYIDPQGRVVHREIAVKYYLGLHDTPDHSSWVGPSRVDRLDRKCDRLITHQLRLPQLALQRQCWPDDLPVPTRAEVLFVGAFFRHPAHTAVPDRAHASAEIGFWCTSDEVTDVAPASQWTMLPKPWWLSPAQDTFESELDAQTVRHVVEQRQHPVLVKVNHQRGFVVPRQWLKR